MLYIKRAFQAAFLFAVIYLTIQNYSTSVNVKIFYREINEVSIVLVIFFSVVLGALLSAFFSALREFATQREFRRVSKENKKLNREIDDMSKDITILRNETEKQSMEKDRLLAEIDTLKDVLKMPQQKYLESGDY